MRFGIMVVLLGNTAFLRRVTPRVGQASAHCRDTLPPRTGIRIAAPCGKSCRCEGEGSSARRYPDAGLATPQRRRVPAGRGGQSTPDRLDGAVACRLREAAYPNRDMC